LNEVLYQHLKIVFIETSQFIVKRLKELYLCGGGKFAYKTKKNHVVVYYLLLLKESSKHITFI
jgi:hypothetical protein